MYDIVRDSAHTFVRADGRTDTVIKTNDHLFGGRGLVGQKGREEKCWSSFPFFHENKWTSAMNIDGSAGKLRLSQKKENVKEE